MNAKSKRIHFSFETKLEAIIRLDKGETADIENWCINCSNPCTPPSFSAIRGSFELRDSAEVRVRSWLPLCSKELDETTSKMILVCGCDRFVPSAMCR